MNRVWKRFFRKLAEPVSFALYFFGTMLLADMLGDKYGAQAFIGVWVVMIVIPVGVWMLKEIYRQAKWEVDAENREVINELKG